MVDVPLLPPWSRLPYVHDDTALLPDETMGALDQRYALPPRLSEEALDDKFADVLEGADLATNPSVATKAPLADRIRLGVGRLGSQLSLTQPAATLRTAGNHNVWDLDDSASNVRGLVSSEVDLPLHWQTVRIVLRYTKTHALNGDARVRVSIVQDAAGDLTSGARDFDAPYVTVSAPAVQFAVREIVLASAVVVDPSRPFVLVLWRNPLDAADVLAGAISVISVSVERDS